MNILDLETDGLWPEVTTIHCAVLYDIETKSFYEYGPDDMKSLVEMLKTCKNLSCHNGTGFDLKVLKKVLNYEYKGVYEDTLLLSRILWPDIDPVPGIKEKHSVDAWGRRFGMKKPVHEDWTKFSPEMLHRCKEDVKIQAKLWMHCHKYMKEMKEKDSRINFDTPYRMEQKVWEIIERQMEFGWLVDLGKAMDNEEELEGMLKETEEILVPSLPKITVKENQGNTCKLFKKNGELTSHALKWIRENDLDHKDFVGDFCRVKYENMNLKSPTQIKDYLLKNGWKPTTWNYKKDRFNKDMRDEKGNKIKTSPKSPKGPEEWEAVARVINNGNIKLLAKYNVIKHRHGVVKGVIEKTRPDGRAEARANTCGTNTFRMTHSIIVNFPRAEEGNFYGAEMRGMMTVPEGRVLVGCDASGLEARCEAHDIYPISKEEALFLLEGDIHQRNADVFGCSRSLAKSIKYAIGYGCSHHKLSIMLGCSVAKAKKILKQFWRNNPALAELKAKLEEAYKKRGYILSIDGRPLPIRYKHALVNTRFQSSGSILMKHALCLSDHRRRRERLDFEFVGNFHDEFQMESEPSIGDYVGELAVNSIIGAGEHFELNVPLDAEYKIGINWAETH